MSDDWVTIQLFYTTHEANLVKVHLEGAGIECFLPDERTIDADPLLANAIGGVRVQVRHEDVERARQVLEEISPDESDEDGEVNE